MKKTQKKPSMFTNFSILVIRNRVKRCLLLCNVLVYKWLIRLSALTIVNIKYQNQTSKCFLKVEKARGKHPEDISVITGGSKHAPLLNMTISEAGFTAE